MGDPQSARADPLTTTPTAGQDKHIRFSEIMSDIADCDPLECPSARCHSVDAAAHRTVRYRTDAVK
jgi:hypothetical protein